MKGLHSSLGPGVTNTGASYGFGPPPVSNATQAGATGQMTMNPTAPTTGGGLPSTGNLWGYSPINLKNPNHFSGGTL